MNQTKNRYFRNSHCSGCGTLGHGVLNCPLAEEVIQKEKECKAMLHTEHNNQWLPPRNAEGVYNLRQDSSYNTRIPQENGTSLFRVETATEELSWFHANE